MSVKLRGGGSYPWALLCSPPMNFYIKLFIIELHENYDVCDHSAKNGYDDGPVDVKEPAGSKGALLPH